MRPTHISTGQQFRNVQRKQGVNAQLAAKLKAAATRQEKIDAIVSTFTWREKLFFKLTSISNAFMRGFTRMFRLPAWRRQKRHVLTPQEWIRQHFDTVPATPRAPLPKGLMRYDEVERARKRKRAENRRANLRKARGDHGACNYHTPCARCQEELSNG